MFEMKPEYYTGIDLIDNEHKELFRIAREVSDLLKDPFIADKYDNIVGIIGELKNYTVKHFADEEAYMESINYKRMFTQKIQHASFVDKLNSIDLNDIDENQVETLIELMEFVSKWLVSHIIENDLLIGK